MAVETFPINVGPLTGIGSLCLYTAKRLKAFTTRWKRGETPRVVWDLSSVQPRHMSMAGLTAFLSLVHRMRQFTGRAQDAHVRWDPQVFAFWEDISLLRIVEEYDLLRWPEGSLGGFTPGATNPDTQILVFPYSRPASLSVSAICNDWKDTVREAVKEDLVSRCGRLLTPRRGQPQFSSLVKERVAITCAELVLNALFHGRTAAFVGLQRTSRGVTVAVCDAGRGFPQSLAERISRLGLSKQVDGLAALLLGSLINLREMGLRRAIGTVVREGGYVAMSSADGEIRWEEPLWQRVVSLAPCEEGALVEELDVTGLLGQPTEGRVSADRLPLGYSRIWDCELRGSRVSFEMRFGDNRLTM